MAAHPAGGAGALDAVDGLSGDAHVAAAEVEAGDVQDRLVAELEGAEPGTRVGLGPVLGGAHRGGRPGVAAGRVQPGVDRVRPGLPVSDGVAAGEADSGLDAVGDGRLAAGREDDGLVAAGGEVAEGVVGAVGLEEGTDAGLLVAVQGRHHALGAEQRGGGVQQGEGAEQSEDEEQPAWWPAVEGSARRQSAADPVGGPQESLAVRQGPREELHQAPADQDRDDESGDQDEQGPPYGAAPRVGVELAAGHDQQGQQEPADDQGGHGLRVQADGDAEDVGEDQQPEVDDHQPPGDLLAGGRGGGEQEEEDGVGEVGADRDDQQVEEACDRAQHPAQRGDEGQYGAEQSDDAEEGRETLGHLAEESARGRPCRSGSVLGRAGLHGGTHASDCRKGRPPRPSSDFSGLPRGRGTCGFR